MQDCSRMFLQSIQECSFEVYTPEMLFMLQYSLSTQKTESLNHSVATLDPKGKDYSQSSSLKTRVILTAGAQIVGHYSLWNRIFTQIDIVMDENLVRNLKKRDMYKGKIQIMQKSKACKSSCSTNRYTKFAESHRSQIEDSKTGAQYESGVAVENTTETLKLAPE